MKRHIKEDEFREKLITWMVEKKGYPPSFLSKERTLSSLVHIVDQKMPDRRFDLVCFDYNQKPLLLIECKREPFTNQAIDQALGYNFFIQAPCVIIIEPSSMVVLYKQLDGYEESDEFPSFAQLLSRTAHSRNSR